MLDGVDIASAARPAVTLSGVSVTAGGVLALSSVDLDMSVGGPTLLLGPNGAGKTTLLRVIMGLAPPSEGRVVVPGRINGTPMRCAFVFQTPVMLRRSVAGNVSFAFAAAGRMADAQAISALLSRVGLSELANRPARKLSGGEARRLALARALAREPDILLLDEPTASLDAAQAKVVEDIIIKAAAAGVKVVMASHDLGQARRLASDIVLLVGGRVIEHAPAAQFFSQPKTEHARRFLAGDLVI